MDGMKLEIEFYIDRLKDLHGTVNKKYKRYKDIAMSDPIAPVIIDHEDRFVDVLRKFIELEEYVSRKKVKDPRIKRLLKKIEIMCERTIQSTTKNTETYVFNYSLKKRLISVLRIIDMYQKNIMELMK
jgi:hypothetical protein